MIEQATPEQIKFANSLGIPTPWEHSKQELRVMIQEKVDKPEVERPKYAKPGASEIKPQKEFHLSPEQVNTNALNSALEWGIAVKYNSSEAVLQLATKFKEFIENGN